MSKEEQRIEELQKLILKSMEILPFTDAIKPAKVASPQTYVYHSISVGTLSYTICEKIAEVDSEGLKNLENIYGYDYRELCYFGGFFHDWMKLYSTKEEKSFKFLPDAREKARELAKKTGIPNAEKLVDHVYTFAEGPLSNNLELPLWLSVKLADMLMISEINSVSDVYKFAESPNYIDAIRALRNYGLDLHYISASPRLFTILASEDIMKSVNGTPLITYKDGFVYISGTDSSPLPLSKIREIFESRFRSVDIKNIADQIERCISNKEEEWNKLNSGDFSVLYNEKSGEKKPKQLNAFLPTKVCTPFEDVVGNLSPQDRIAVAEMIIGKLRDKIPYGVITYFTEKFSRYDEDYIKSKLDIKDKFPKYLEGIKLEDTQKLIDQILNAIREKYSKVGANLTIASFVKKSFNGYINDDIDLEKIPPKNYCVVCGIPIYDEVVNFKQFSTLLGGKTEIWIPRETGLDEIDRVRDNWAICPICNYEALQLKGDFAPPFILVSFYPGVPILLLEALSTITSALNSQSGDEEKKSLQSLVISKHSTYYNVFIHSLYKIQTFSKSVKADYLGGKVIIPATEITSKKSTRLDKNTLNDILYYIPYVSSVYLFSPIIISASIYDFPITTNTFEISSEINYLWTRVGKTTEEDNPNYITLLLLLAYNAKYTALRNTYKNRDEFENVLNSMINDMDMFASVSRSLSVIALGIAVNEARSEDESKLIRNIKFFIPFLDFAFSGVDKMGESFSKSLNAIAKVLVDAVKDQKVSKHQIVGFLRDGIDMFFKSYMLDKDDRISIAANTALNTLSNNFNITDEDSKNLFYNLKNVFSNLYEIESTSDRSLAISISTALVNWLYLLYLYRKSGEEENE
ncbi:CRISPR-associated protein [Sulfolobus sp. S-194]|uniref:HD domain-containing protein n=1 Tax=Sulfolobus sp. S-194 TaxID=2512240 RepID=UPI0014372999|nr:HD domain-containing protein [Sulfolobus sp. S-194]QIW22847.1 CRISPR-associated protein [Sulfolobus sp. S-194]